MYNTSCFDDKAKNHTSMQNMKAFSKINFFSMKGEMKQKRKAIPVRIFDSNFWSLGMFNS